MISVELQNPRTDPYSQALALYQLDADRVNLREVEKAELIAAVIFTFTLSAAMAQQHYYPLGPISEQGILIAALTPLPVVLIIEGIRQQGQIINQINDYRR